MKEIVLLCPWNVQTGGPEAIHQLSNELIELGLKASIFYTVESDLNTLNKILNSKPDLNYLEIEERINTIEEYKKYKINSIKRINFDDNTIIVFPETYLGWTFLFKNNKCLIWWLSVDNAFSYLDIKKININTLKDQRFTHAYQSLYARDFLMAMRFKNLHALSDWTPEIEDKNEYKKEIISMSALPHKIHINVDYYKKEIEDYCGLEVRLLRGMARDEIYKNLSKSYIYIDFGNFPGKDRMPREALMRNCCLITSDSGAAYTNEFYIPEEYVINTSNPNLLKYACKSILSRYESNMNRYQVARDKISNEKMIFKFEILDLFSKI
jgi:hypothetical protein